MDQTKLWKETKESFASFCETIAALRHPTTGCPWDLEQTHETLRKYMIEEAYEATEVMSPINYEKLCDELGDVLLQVVLNSQLATDDRKFTINDVINGINSKMRRRHPHVFGEQGDKSALASRDKGQIRSKWEEIKANEKLAANAPSKSSGIFSSIQLNKMIPASHAAIEIGKVARKINFDWSDAKQVIAQLESEISELKQEIENGGSSQRIADEMGDVMFSTAQLCRHLNLSPEVCGHDGNRKFLNRFSKLEQIAASKGINVSNAPQSQLEELWKLAKNTEAGK